VLVKNSVVVVSAMDEGFATFSEQAELRIFGGYVCSGTGVLSGVLEGGVRFSWWDPLGDGTVVVWVCVTV